MKHGMHKTPTYNSWISMKRRCGLLKGNPHPNYTGIKMEERWLDFSTFLYDMGIRPEGTTLDRINNELGYALTNCRWATPKEQQNNRTKFKQYNNNKSGYTGVHWDKERNKWFAQVRRNSKTIALGRFDSIEDAKLARDLFITGYLKK